MECRPAQRGWRTRGEGREAGQGGLALAGARAGPPLGAQRWRCFTAWPWLAAGNRLGQFQVAVRLICDACLSHLDSSLEWCCGKGAHQSSNCRS